MRAAVGDVIVVMGHRAGESRREALILGVEGEDGGPPYGVRWEDTGQEALFFPGPDSVIEHYPPTTPGSSAAE
jgi:uncharacterized protein DUF1918